MDEGKSTPRKKMVPPSPEKIEANLGPLDWAIFERLPDEGEILGYHPLIKSVRHLRDELNAPLPPEALMTSGFVSGRMRLLKIAGFVVPVTIGLGDKPGGWQRTPKAVEFLNRHKAEEAERDRIEAEARAAELYRDQQAQTSTWAPIEGGH